MLTTLGQIIPEASRQYGSKTALVCEDTTLTFRELEALTGQLGKAMVELGVIPGDRITLYTPNCWEWLVTYYAALRVGAVINPVNVMLTPEEVEYVVQDCGASILIGSPEKITPLVGIQDRTGVRELICFGEDTPDGTLSFSHLLDKQDAVFDVNLVDTDSLSTICYTSGTTGHPKGAMHSHRNVLMNTLMTSLMHGRSDQDTVVTALPCSHVYGNVVMNAAMLHGMTLVLHPRFDEAAVLDSIQKHQGTLFEGVPAMYMFLLDYQQLDDYDLSSLRACTVGGQTMPVSKMVEVEERFGCPLIELWGMTEIAGLGTTFAHNGPVEHGSIGVTLPYVDARIAAADDAAKELPVNEIGELMIKGPIVMLGYYNNDKATRETIESDGWLHTGDIARMDESGNIYIVDRKKDMIITAGYNIYPAELERVIAGHADVAMVAVGSIPDEEKGELAKAYIIPKKGAQAEEDAILSYCRERLAAYKMPRAIQFVEDFPKTSSGKIMRRKLHELDLRD